MSAEKKIKMYTDQIIDLVNENFPILLESYGETVWEFKDDRISLYDRLMDLDDSELERWFFVQHVYFKSGMHRGKELKKHFMVNWQLCKEVRDYIQNNHELIILHLL